MCIKWHWCVIVSIATILITFHCYIWDKVTPHTFFKYHQLSVFKFKKVQYLSLYYPSLSWSLLTEKLLSCSLFFVVSEDAKIMRVYFLTHKILRNNRQCQSALVCSPCRSTPNRAHVDLGVAAVKSTESTWPLQVKSSRFNSKSLPKFSTQVAAEF